MKRPKNLRHHHETIERKIIYSLLIQKPTMTMYDFKQYDFRYYVTSLAAGSTGTCITHTGKG